MKWLKSIVFLLCIPFLGLSQKHGHRNGDHKGNHGKPHKEAKQKMLHGDKENAMRGDKHIKKQVYKKYHEPSKQNMKAHQQTQKVFTRKPIATKQQVYYTPYKTPILVQHGGVKHKHKGPPPWAPANGYKHRHIYFPEYGCYYDTWKGYYIYRKGFIWVRSYTMPMFIININTTRKVETDVANNVEDPQVSFGLHFWVYK